MKGGLQTWYWFSCLVMVPLPLRTEGTIYLSHVPSPIPPTVTSAIIAEGVWADASLVSGSCQALFLPRT